MARIRDIVVDAVRPAALARFWAEVLDGYQIRSYEAAELERLSGLGLTPETDPAVAVDGPGPTLWFQQAPERKRTRNRVHLDLVGADRGTEVARLCALGASVRDEHGDHSVLQDPEGNEFCVLDPDRGSG